MGAGGGGGQGMEELGPAVLGGSPEISGLQYCPLYIHHIVCS